MSLLAPTLQAFFAERLAQLNASPHTIGSYRDTFRLLLAFASEQVGKQPCELDIDHLDAPLIGAFLNHLEQDRGNSPRTRNNRLAAIHSLYRYSALRHPEHLQTIGRVMAIPAKRYERNNVNYLDRHEIEALLAAPDRNSWHGRRDHALLLVAIQTGLRVAELIGLRIRDVNLAIGAHVLARGKGRKQRAVTLRPETVAILRQWLTERHGQPDDPLFPTRQGQPLSPDAVEQLVAKHAAAAARTCDSLNSKHVTPHALRHYVEFHVSGTPTRCCSARKASTSPRSPCGSGTKAPRPPTSTNTPTPHSKNKQSHEPPRSAPSPAATDHPTRSSPSSKPCDYVERAVGLNRQITGHRARAQHNRSHDIQPVTWNST